MKDTGSWMSEESLRKILRSADAMKDMSQEEKKSFKERVLAAWKDASEPPEDLAHCTAAIFPTETFALLALLVLFFFVSGAVMERAWRKGAKARGDGGRCCSR